MLRVFERRAGSWPDIHGVISKISSRKMVRALGQFQFARKSLGSPGEGAPFITEEFALHEVFRQGGAIDADHGFAAPGAVPVDQLRDLLLAGARLSGDQDIAGAGRRPDDIIFDLPDAGGLADEGGSGLPGPETPVYRRGRRRRPWRGGGGCCPARLPGTRGV